MPSTAPRPAGPMMKKKFSGVRPRTSTAKPGPMAPSTPIRLEADPQVGKAPGDHPVRAHEVDALAQLAEQLVDGATGRVAGRSQDLGRPHVRQRQDRERGDGRTSRDHDVHRDRTQHIEHERPEEPEADREGGVDREDEDRVRRHQVSAVDDPRDRGQLGRREDRGRGRDPEVDRVDERDVRVAVVGATKMNPMVPTARITFVASMISFALLRSTRTPPSVLNSTAGTRNVRIRTATAVSEPVVRRTVAMSAASTMLLASWLSAWADQR